MSALSSSSVWERTSSGGTLSKRVFAFMLCLWTSAGVAATAVASAISQSWHLTGGSLLALTLGAFVVSIIGTLIAMKSDNPVISLFGYALVAIPFGLMLGPVIALYTPASVAKVTLITAMMSVSLGLIGAIYPKSLESWGGWLFGGLLILIFGQFITVIAGAFGVDVRGAMTVWDWIGVVLFSAYIIFDLNRAMRVERTHDNAIDCALAVYLDIINLFIRLLSIMGDRKD